MMPTYLRFGSVIHAMNVAPMAYSQTLAHCQIDGLDFGLACVPNGNPKDLCL